jgi:hypothetical protein
VALSALLVGCAGGGGDNGFPVPVIGMTADATTSDPSSDESSTGTSEDVSTGSSFTTDVLDTGTESTGDLESSGSSGGGMMCSNMESCNNAPVLGTVSGDESSPALHASGSEPTWLTFRVTEDNDSITGESLSFTATLTSPAGYDFDLFVFRGADGGTTGCGGVTDESTATGQVDLVAMTWGEGGVANGGDESAWVAVQIEVKGGTCDPTAEWTLDVEGDT